MPMRAQAREGARVREGHWGEHPQSRLRGDDSARSGALLDVYLIRSLLFSFSGQVHRGGGNYGCILLQLKSTIFRVAILSCVYS
jgi:hypothetical protein